MDMRRIHGAFGYCAVDKSDLLFTSSVNLVISVISCGKPNQKPSPIVPFRVKTTPRLG